MLLIGTPGFISTWTTPGWIVILSPKFGCIKGGRPEGGRQSETKGFEVKKLLLISLVLVIAISIFAIPAQAQTEKTKVKTSWGAGIQLFDGEFGLEARKDFWLGGDISQITGQVGILFVDDAVMTLDLDYHFSINTDSGTSRFYPLVGLDFKTDFDYSEFGLNLGGGANFMMTEKLAAFAELKYVFSDWEGFGVALGVYF
jgi:hypothetical protein